MKVLNQMSWLIQLIVTTIILLFGFNYTNGKNCQLLEQTAITAKQSVVDIIELRKADEKTYEKLICSIHQLDKTIAILNAKIEYQNNNSKRR